MNLESRGKWEGSGRGRVGNEIDAVSMYKIISENAFLKYLKCTKYMISRDYISKLAFLIFNIQNAP